MSFPEFTLWEASKTLIPPQLTAFYVANVHEL